MPDGLKKELGLGEPKSPAQGSTEQADNFKAAFQAKLQKVNGNLQYTAVHAEQVKHDPQAGKRDKTCSAYQVALGKIDPTNPSAAQGAIDQVLKAVDGLGSTAESFKQTVEKAFTAWTEREDDFDALQDKVREMAEWGHEKAGALQKVVEGVTQKVSDKKYEESLKVFDGLSGKAKPIIEDYTKQKEAQGEYEQGLGEVDPKLAKVSDETPEDIPDDLKEKKKEIESKSKEMRESSLKKDFLAALEVLKNLGQQIADYLAELAKQLKIIADYQAARKAAEASYEKAHFLANSYATLKKDQQKLKPKFDAMEAAAQAKNYEEAKKLADELKTASDAYLAKAKKEQEQYDKKAADITKELDDADDLKRQDVARKIAGKLKPDMIKHMPIEVRNRLMLEMQKGGFSDDDKKAMDNLYKTRTLDPEFEEAERVKREELIRRMKEDPEFAKAREDWGEMKQDEKIEFMEKAANLHAEVYGNEDEEPKIKVKAYNKEPEKDDKGKVTSYSNGTYNHRTGELRINTNDYEKVKFNDFDRALDLVTHETGHRYQNVLADRIDRKDDDPTKLKPGDPEYQQAVSFRVNDPRHGYYRQPGPPWEIYLNQPMEAHSRESGGEVAGSGIGEHDHKHDHDHEH